MDLYSGWISAKRIAGRGGPAKRGLSLCPKRRTIIAVRAGQSICAGFIVQRWRAGAVILIAVMTFYRYYCGISIRLTLGAKHTRGYSYALTRRSRKAYVIRIPSSILSFFGQNVPRPLARNFPRNKGFRLESVLGATLACLWTRWIPKAKGTVFLILILKSIRIFYARF